MRVAQRLGKVRIGCQYFSPHLAYSEGKRTKLGEGEVTKQGGGMAGFLLMFGIFTSFGIVTFGILTYGTIT